MVTVPLRAVPLPVTLSVASWLYRLVAMLLATQRKTPASTFLTPVTWRTPLGRSVYLDRQVRGQRSASLLGLLLQDPHVPAVGGVQRCPVPLPADGGLRDPFDLALEASHAPLAHAHGCWVGVELGES